MNNTEGKYNYAMKTVSQQNDRKMDPALVSITQKT